MNTYHAGLFCFILACLISPDVRELCFLLAALVDRPGGVCYNNRCLDTRLRTHGHDKQLPHQHGVSCGCTARCCHVHTERLSYGKNNRCMRAPVFYLFLGEGTVVFLRKKFFFVCLCVFPSFFPRFHSSLIASPFFTLPERFSHAAPVLASL